MVLSEQGSLYTCFQQTSRAASRLPFMPKGGTMMTSGFPARSACGLQSLPTPSGNPTRLKRGCDPWSSPDLGPRFKGPLVQPLSVLGQDTLRSG